MSRFINTEIKSESHSDSESEPEPKPDTELMAKLKSVILILNKSFYS